MPGKHVTGLPGLTVIAVVAVAGLWPAAAAQATTRSAQGDCTREANRRGYQVVRSGDFRQIPDGWQLTLTLRNLQGRSDEGVCTVRTSTAQVSFSGFDFGGGESGGMRFDCQSEGYKYRECQLPVDGRARMVRQYSKATAAGGTCQEGYSWGQRGDRVWVNHGCRAEFEVERGTPGGGGGGGGMQQRVKAACRREAERQYITVLNVTPGRNQGGYWQATVHGKLRGQVVHGDCRFDPQTSRASIFVGPPGGGPGNELKVRAEQACMAHAKRLGYTVYGQSAAVPAAKGLTVALKLKQGNRLSEASCFYDTRSGQTRLDPVRPQPR